ncbi:MAG: hypothetical protein V3S33_02350 [Gammaproteobacteria bacterium]
MSATLIAVRYQASDFVELTKARIICLVPGLVALRELVTMASRKDYVSL